MNAFYFALPRLLACPPGDRQTRSEKNWLEANVVGTLNHLVVYAFAFALLLAGRPTAQQCWLLLPLAFVVLVFWLLFFYVNACFIRLLRLAGGLRDLPNNRAQTLLIAIFTSAMAAQLLFADGWPRAVGVLWLSAVVMNLSAAAVLRLLDAARHAN